MLESNHHHLGIEKQCLDDIFDCLLLLLPPPVARLAINWESWLSLIIDGETVVELFDQACEPVLEGKESVLMALGQTNVNSVQPTWLNIPV